MINLDRFEEAGIHVEKVLAGNPSHGFAHRLMAMVQFRAGKFRLADESIRRAISLNPNDANNWHQLAHMSYRQADLATARKCVARARELNPRDADILNLAILCEPNDPETVSQRIQQYQEALALDPENANLHNNLGTQYLNTLKDYGKAEACFRRALFFEPSSKLFRKNLFLTVRRRDLVYRLLCGPKDWLLQVINFFARTRKKSLWLYLLMIPLWLLAFRFVFGGLVLWFALVWPLTKVYEYLTIGDIRARAGELGVRRGGFLNYRPWPFRIRLFIFAVLLISFWGGLAFVGWNDHSAANPDRGEAILGGLLLIAVIAILGYYLRLKIRQGLEGRAARKRARKMEDIFNAHQERKT